MDSFQSFLESLNPQQREAVDHIEGPVMVLAGPGTGKTHVLAARIGKILLETDTRPQNILCLTFTDAAVSAMRQRLLSMIGPEAYRIPIFTFHGFCNRVIQENLELFSRTELEPISELERVELIQVILENLPTDHPLRAGKRDAFQYEKQVQNLFQLMKRESWNPGFIHRHIRVFLENLDQNPEYLYKVNTKHGKKGSLKEAAAKQIREKMDILHAAADLYPEFEKALRKAGRYEYDDMLLWVLKAFQSNEALLRNYQERYLYFLVDEYQDTNTAQYQLLQSLLDYWDKPNVFVVGDDDQSIFEFQGARLQNLVLFYKRYEADMLTVVLHTNYRSTQAILDASAQLIEQNTLRAVNALQTGLDKKLTAHQQTTLQPQVLAFPNRLHELDFLIRKVGSLHDSGVPLQEIAVLYPKHKQAEAILELFQKNNIPYQTKRPVDILQIPMIEQFIGILAYIRDELNQAFSGDFRLFRILHAAYWELEPLDLARIALYLNERQTAGADMYWREVLSDEDLLKSLHLKTPLTRWKQVHQRIESWIGMAAQMPVLALLEPVLNQSGLLKSILEHPDKSWWLQVVHRFMELAREEDARKPPLHLDAFLDTCTNMRKSRISAPVYQIMGHTEGVQLLSVHAAKGLEFDHVFMIDCSSGYWEPSNRGTAFQFTLPETLTISTAEEDALEARRRLFYVAMTRAKTGLYMSYSEQNIQGKIQMPARFIPETGLSPQTMESENAAIEDQLQTQFSISETPLIQVPENEYLDRSLENFRLSVTSLNRYLRCPRAFYFEDLLGIPGFPSEAAAYGQSMHQAVQFYFLKYKKTPGKDLPPPDGLIHSFTQAMAKRKGLFTAVGYEQRLALGTHNLSTYFKTAIPRWTKRAVVERNIDRTELEGVPIKGVLDKIEWLNDGSIRIIDYKTGNSDSKKLRSPDEKHPQGSPFWRQLVFYKLLLESSKIYSERVHTTAIEWLEPDSKGQFKTESVVPDKTDEAFLMQLIKDCYEKIQNREFEAGCGEPDCEWCQLVNNRELPTRFAHPEEQLDD
jgi:DNA helicase-2/ATP-dependent DNA helicase PcrA